MLEKLFFDEWDWWYWGVAAVPFLMLTTWAAWRMSKQEAPAETLAKNLAENTGLLRRVLAEPDRRKRSEMLIGEHPRVAAARVEAEQASIDLQVFHHKMRAAVSRSQIPEMFRRKMKSVRKTDDS